MEDDRKFFGKEIFNESAHVYEKMILKLPSEKIEEEDENRALI